MVKLTFPHIEVFIIVGEEGARVATVEFIEKNDKLAIDVSWKGKMPINYEAYDRRAEMRIAMFLKAHGIEISSITTQDFGKDRQASKNAIKNFLNETIN